MFIELTGCSYLNSRFNFLKLNHKVELRLDQRLDNIEIWIMKIHPKQIFPLYVIKDESVCFQYVYNHTDRYFHATILDKTNNCFILRLQKDHNLHYPCSFCRHELAQSRSIVSVHNVVL